MSHRLTALCPWAAHVCRPILHCRWAAVPIGTRHTAKVPVHAHRGCLAAASAPWPVKRGVTPWATKEVCAGLLPVLGQAAGQAELGARQAERAPQADQQQLLPDVTDCLQPAPCPMTCHDGSLHQHSGSPATADRIIPRVFRSFCKANGCSACSSCNAVMLTSVTSLTCLRQGAWWDIGDA